LRAKDAKCAAIKKVMSFVFKYFLASFPLFFILRDALGSRDRSVFPGTSARPALVCDKVSPARPQK